VRDIHGISLILRSGKNRDRLRPDTPEMQGFAFGFWKGFHHGLLPAPCILPKSNEGKVRIQQRAGRIRESGRRGPTI